MSSLLKKFDNSRSVPFPSALKKSNSNESKTVPLASVFKNLLPDSSKIEEQKSILKLKQQTVKYIHRIQKEKKIDHNLSFENLNKILDKIQIIHIFRIFEYLLFLKNFSK